MSVTREDQAQGFDAAQADLESLEKRLGQVIVGQDALVHDLVTAVFAGGHVLLEGLPGLGKTQLAKAIAGSFGLRLARIQCTPDLMPADITGSEILAGDMEQRQQLEFREGPIFAAMVLVDEINRATPKTQAALLEAMQENQVTYMGTRYPLPEPFWVLATQNPIELEGTYPLPEAQLDRFLLKLSVRYPAADALLDMLDVSLDQAPSSQLSPLLTSARIESILAVVRQVLVARPIREAAIDLILATQPSGERTTGPARQHIRYGASPRGLLALIRTARARALLNKRVHVAIEDLAAVALPVLRHRVLLNMESEMSGTDVDSVLSQIVQVWLEKW